MSSKEQPLSSDEFNQLLAWTPPWYAIPVHAEIEYQLQRGLDGKENTVVIGMRGVGKSETVRSALRGVAVRELERAELRKQALEAGTVLLPHEENLPAYPRQALIYQASESSGTKTAVSDLLLKLNRPVKPSEARSWTPTNFAEKAYQEIRRRQVHLVCIDEAQFISPDNLEHLRQVQDVARDEGFSFGIVLIGDYRLRARVAATGQLGQRYTGLVDFPRFDSLAGELELWHPHLPQIKKELKPGEWNRLTREFLVAANGTFRRFVAVLENANALAIRLNTRVTPKVLEMAIRKLAPEA